MKDGPWIRFFPSDWLAGTRGLSAAETGIYITLIAMMYERGAPIQNDAGRLARLCGTTPAAFKATLGMLIESGKVELVDGALWNRRVGVEAERRREKSSQAAESADKRWGKRKEKQDPTDATAKQPQSDSNANQISELEPSSSLRSEEGGARRNERPSVIFQAVLDPLTAKTYADHIGRKLTPEMAGLLVDVLREVKRLGGSPVEAVKLAMRKGWSSLDVEWLRNAGMKLGAVPKPTAAEFDWRKALDVFDADGYWAPGWGPRPGEAGCRVPQRLLAGRAA